MYASNTGGPKTRPTGCRCWRQIWLPVMVASGGTVTALAAKAATATVPVVFVIGADPVKRGLVASINRPGGNMTGVSFLVDALVAKRLKVLRELLPAANSIGLLVNPKNPNADSNMKDVDIAAHAFGQEVHAVIVGSEDEFHLAFTNLAQMRVAALFVVPTPSSSVSVSGSSPRRRSTPCPRFTTVGKPSPMAV
jgi:putative ABC transport system substrate-binding protein